FPVAPPVPRVQGDARRPGLSQKPVVKHRKGFTLTYGHGLHRHAARQGTGPSRRHQLVAYFRVVFRSPGHLLGPGLYLVVGPRQDAFDFLPHHRWIPPPLSLQELPREAAACLTVVYAAPAGIT